MKNLINFIFETFHLKRIKHEGPRLAGVDFPDSVAEHSLNAAQIGYILAKMEGADANKVSAILIWHDLAETRIGDIHKVGSRYIQGKKEFEKHAMEEQLVGLEFGSDIKALFDEYEQRSTLEGMIAKDADYLEQAFQAKIWIEQGYQGMQNRIDNVGGALRTNSAKAIWNQMVKSSSNDWWAALKKLPREK